MIKTIVIFANSIKHGKHCVAGKCFETKKWIRPVSNSLGGELSNIQATYTNQYGTFMVKPKQKIEMNFLSHVPIINQPDNYLIGNKQWFQRYNIKDYEINKYLDTPIFLWGNTNSVPYNLILSKNIIIEKSLYLIQTQNLNLYKNSFKQRRANFTYNNIKYDFPVTDPLFDKIVFERKKTSGILCISLGENYNGYCYKIVATIF